MKFVLLIALIVALQISLVIHIQSLFGYIATKSQKYFKSFMVTAVSNSLVGISLAIFVMLDSTALNALNLDMILLLESGFIFLYMIGVKVMVVIKILKRLRDPENFHLNHFGKKVYHTTIVPMREMAIFFVSMPFTVMLGAYFIAKLFKM